MDRKVAATIASLTLLVTTVFLLAAPSATATFHLMKITEVYAGSPAQSNSQFIELTMYAGGQNNVNGQSVEVFNAAGTSVGVFTFTGNVSNGTNQSSILIATSAAVTEFGVSTDLAMTAVIPAGGGKVCFAGTIDCVSWGNYSGGSAQTGTPFNAGGGIPSASSMARNFGSNGTLEEADDTNNGAADFTTSSPTPKNNAGTAVTTTTTTSTTMPGATTTTTTQASTTTTEASSTTTTTMPPQANHSRSISLRKDGGFLKGRVSVADGTAACRSFVPLKLQKKKPSGWRTVAGTRTNDAGRYRFVIGTKTGKFRSKAMRVEVGSDTCLAATSSVRTLG